MSALQMKAAAGSPAHRHACAMQRVADAVEILRLTKRYTAVACRHGRTSILQGAPASDRASSRIRADTRVVAFPSTSPILARKKA
jgi:hypothetical protein